MTCPNRLFAIVLVILVGISSKVFARPPAGDVITLKNGDIYNGRVHDDLLQLNSEAGILHIPISSIVTLVSKPAQELVEITTTGGEKITGTPLLDSLRMERLQDPALPVSLNDIIRIELDRRHLQDPSPGFPSRLEAVSGDLLNVQVISPSITLETEQGVRDLPVSALQSIDINVNSYEDTLMAQTRLQNGEFHRGVIKTQALQLKSPYLASILLLPGQISRITVDRAQNPAQEKEIFSDSLRGLGFGPEMVRIPGGRYLRGDFQGDGDDDEHPLAEVRLKPFAISRFEITFDQYELFCGQTRCALPDDSGWGRGDRPVINVSWQEANAYVNWLAEKTGKSYRLPSDAEWEYASRAGKSTRYAWGDEVESGHANCDGCGSIWDGDKTARVGRFEPNAFGLYDTAGNVFEWVADCFHDRFSEAPADGSPIEKAGCGKRVIRGGAWSFPPHEVRSANRWRDFPSRRSDDTGFRVALELEPDTLN